MKTFPVFCRLDVDGYGLFPGVSDATPGLHVDFPPGLTLVVGANGLGKTTLITLIFRLLAGPYDIPALGVGDELGFRRLAAAAIPSPQRSILAARVGDRAATATARLEFMLGSIVVVVERRLSDLGLISALFGASEITDESILQAEIAAASGLGSFGDFILMLRYLVFYFEDRRQLVWDPSAQRQLLRMLFLPADIAQRWTELERSILQNDSRMRNFQAVVGREEKLLNNSLAKASNAAAVRGELQALDALQEQGRARLEEIEPFTDAMDSRRQEARLSHLKAKQEREARFRALEHAKLVAIEARFPGRLETGRYMVAHLMSEMDCLVCGSHAPEAAAAYAARLTGDKCVVCDSDLSRSAEIVEARDVADERVVKSERLLELADRELAGAVREREIAEAEFDAHTLEVTRLNAEIASRSARLSRIIELLPPDEAVLRTQRGELAAIRGRLESMKTELAAERTAFREFVEQCTDELLASASQIVEGFELFAGAFLSERVSLTWAMRSAAVGQSGEAIPFPAFELNMTGSDFSDAVRRAGPGDVSESQREFIDLAFRMALMRSSSDGSAALIIDTPESSLDAVFAKRAGNVLLRFAGEGENRLLVTSNLIEGSLLPTLVGGLAATPEKADRLVDLFEVAKPTRAVSDDRDEYDRLRERLFEPLA
ncbi:MAG TPA: AAA family ATPase [Phenylobacterium sp.]|uniref:ATP-binding protein n=1 Tax=Phenylobacterium sp. TaxID=1871053 RepID=UPI002C1DA4B7|nr:AAA family ATPase [Phenylobacterium sp.]HXA40288.1 AAA family ATPase [Phenylobacterium sp.]